MSSNRKNWPNLIWLFYSKLERSLLVIVCADGVGMDFCVVTILKMCGTCLAYLWFDSLGSSGDSIGYEFKCSQRDDLSSVSYGNVGRCSFRLKLMFPYFAALSDWHFRNARKLAMRAEWTLEKYGQFNMCYRMCNQMCKLPMWYCFARINIGYVVSVRSVR